MRKKFNVLSSCVEKEKSIWTKLWEKTSQKEVFLNPNYASIYNNEQNIAKCAVYQGENTLIMYVFIQRKIDIEIDGKYYYDLITPYGYGGAYYSGEKCSSAEVYFNDSFKAWCEVNNVVSEFVRFSLFNENLIKYLGKVEENNLNIICDLEKEQETIWKNFKHKVRKNVKKAIANGVTVSIDNSGETLNHFLEIYYNTMERNNANSQYYFSKSYFENIIKNLNNNYIIINALKDNKIISTELILISKEVMYSFLGGTKSEYFDIRPNDILKYEAILWGKKNGIKKYVLGGGYTLKDGIYQYKLAFDPNGIKTYSVGKRIFNEDIYNKLTDKVLKNKSKEDLDKSYFPLYRVK